jgi:hypothetical protein
MQTYSLVVTQKLEIIKHKVWLSGCLRSEFQTDSAIVVTLGMNSSRIEQEFA